DADRAWIKPEIDLYCLVTEACREEFAKNGAPRDRTAVWGATLTQEFGIRRDRDTDVINVCAWLDLDATKPLLIVAGGGEGLGAIETTARRLLGLNAIEPP